MNTPTPSAAILPFPTSGSHGVQLTPARFVTIELAEVLTGFTQGAIRTKIARGIWLEGRQWVKRDGRVLIDMKGYEIWAELGAA